MLRFEIGRLILYKDIERCPYTFREPEWTEWTRKDEERLELIALERYLKMLDYLKNTHQRII